MRTLQHQVGDTTVARPQRISKGQGAVSVVGAVVVGGVAGWISYLVLSPSETSNTITPAEIAPFRAADMVSSYESQCLSDPVNVAQVKAAELPSLYAAQFASTPEGIAMLPGAELPALYKSQFAWTSEGIAILRGAERATSKRLIIAGEIVATRQPEGYEVPTFDGEG